MTTGILRDRIASLRLRPNAPWPREQEATRAEIVARQVESAPMETATSPTEPCPAFAPSTGQILPFPVASCRNLSK